MAVDYDAIIVGAGLAGLSLLQRLTHGLWSRRRILLLDDGARPQVGAFAHWSTDPTWLAVPGTTAWTAIRVQGDHADLRLPTEPYAYYLVDGDRIGAIARASAARASYDERIAAVTEVVAETTAARVYLDGEELTARWVFDSRAPLPAEGSPTLAFHGWRVRTESTTFDPSVATFMDLRLGGPDHAAFGYVLPLGASDALVEIAEIGWRESWADDAHLAAYVRAQFGCETWAVLAAESGQLPLQVRRTAVRSRVVPIGRRAGMLRPSSGYAFTRIQRHSAAIARSLERHDHPWDVPRPSARHEWLDRVLLRAVHRDPGLLSRAFPAMFDRVGAPAVFAFLDEDSTITGEIRIALSLPWGPFLRAAALVR